MIALAQHVGEVVAEPRLAAAQGPVDRDDHAAVPVLRDDLVGQRPQERDPRRRDESHAPSLAAGIGSSAAPTS